MKKLTAVVVGFGARGARCAEYALDHPDELEIVAVADATPVKLESAKVRHNLPDNMLFTDWKDLATLPKLADFAIIGTQDKLHYAPAMALIEKGYNLLLEKPIAPTAKECKEVAEAAEKKGVKVVICHIMRYTDFWRKIKELLDQDTIGEIKSISYMENVGNEHYAHSFVRGPWRKAADSSCMILAKSCHDMDVLLWLTGKKCKRIQSFGSLTHFTRANQPEGAADRCVDGCPYYETCVYSAKKQYFDRAPIHYFRRVACGTVEETTDEKLREAMKTGPYGRCVYACDNDVVDHQVVNLEFEDGCTVSFSMCGFSEHGRMVRIYGTKGELIAEQDKLTFSVYSFATCERTEHRIEVTGPQDYRRGHGGGDQKLLEYTLQYLRGEGCEKDVSTIQSAYRNHLMSFAAEESRLTGRVIDLDQFSEEI